MYRVKWVVGETSATFDVDSLLFAENVAYRKLRDLGVTEVTVHDSTGVLRLRLTREEH